MADSGRVVTVDLANERVVLATMLHDRAKARSLSIGFAQLERCVNGRTPRVRRAVRELMEELVASSPSS